jgi:flagellar basal body-associated protein FliL
MAEGKNSVIVNAIILLIIILVNVTVTFFVLKHLLQKSQNEILEMNMAQIEAQEKARRDLIKPKVATNDTTGNATNEEVETVDSFEGYNTAEFMNYPMEDMYANIDGKFLVVTMILKFSKENDKLQEVLDSALPDIRANILSLLRRESMTDLEDVNYTSKLRQKIKNRVNQVIQNDEQEMGIDYVLFTQFIIE